LLKIIDPSTHYKYPRDPSDQSNGCVSVTFFSKDKDQLPTFTKVGDIIRIHRANIGTYKNYKTFSVNLAFGSSWVVFAGFPQPRKAVEGADVPGSPSQIIEPRSASSSNYSLQQADADMVKKYREWLAEYFNQSFNYESTLYMNLNKVREFITNEQIEKKQPFPTPREYDLVVRIDSISDAPEDGVNEHFGEANTDYTPGFIRDAKPSPQRPTYKLLTISDVTSLVFEIWIPETMLPPQL
jgi:Telomeric single stranded DNA binding POT1/CDC13